MGDGLKLFAESTRTEGGHAQGVRRRTWRRRVQ